MQSKEGTASCIPAGSNSGDLIAGLKSECPIFFLFQKVRSSLRDSAPSLNYAAM